MNTFFWTISSNITQLKWWSSKNTIIILLNGTTFEVAHWFTVHTVLTQAIKFSFKSFKCSECLFFFITSSIYCSAAGISGSLSPFSLCALDFKCIIRNSTPMSSWLLLSSRFQRFFHLPVDDAQFLLMKLQ